MSENRSQVLKARVLRVAALRRLETAARSHRPEESLMERAGRAVATTAIAMAAERAGPVLVLAGPGNNGGDALVAARELHRRGIDVRVALLGDEAAYEGEALLAWQAWQVAAGHALTVDPDEAIGSAALVVDGLYGIGFRSGTLPDHAKRWIDRVNAAACPVLAIDIPSGVEADTGHVAEVAIEADRTLSFLGRKVGLETGDGLDHRGIVVDDLLGIDRDADLERDLVFDAGDVGASLRPALFRHAFEPRRLNSHKGSNGSVAVVGGNEGTVGAALLASRMALYSGAGRVYVRLLAGHGPGHDVLHPELMIRKSLDGVDADALALGPGLGHGDAAMAAIRQALDFDATLVIDADALNAIAKDAASMTRLARRCDRGLSSAVLTPHPLEAARLLDIDVKAVQRDRLAAACALAKRAGSIVVLKGAGSVIADPSGAWAINPTGNPALATGGTGDVLCGLVAGLAAQGLGPLDAARAATWIHGTAADDLVAGGIGPVGVTASELIPAIRSVVNRLPSEA